MDLRYCIVLLAAGLAGCSRSPTTMAGGHSPARWVQTLHDASATSRARAAHHLGNAGAVDATVVHALTEAIKDPDATVRLEAAVALMKIGRAAKSALPALLEAENDSSPKVREAATKARESIELGKK